ncbi:MAG: glutamate-5-semialdehyde dehydrogenase [Actinobacteria bacterium]|uniref:glutamate-5-semialdehyde dehydrogenase n=1 Tax=freshwater metagenome TaxID=449393 RepID=A0A6J6N4E5_9ZZZZ|nr:glutamate-5-semialdehyde dehydrogenase [Actinomycetota bacterium]
MSALELIKKAKAASRSLGLLTTEQKNEVLKTVSVLLTERTQEILEANKLDLAAAKQLEMAVGMQDRLTLTPERIDSLKVALAELIALNDPIGETVRDIQRPNGLHIKAVRVPFGVIGAIYEARPNVTIDIAGMALKTGNAIVLRGGTAAENTNKVLVKILKDALETNGFNPDAVQTVDEYGRDGATEMMKATGLIDVLIPRGSASLIKTVVQESKVPVIETGDGIVHIFLDATAKQEMAVSIVTNAKVQRPSVCNSLETLLVHKDALGILLPVLEDLAANGVTIHGDETVLGIFPKAVPATEADWATEYLSLDLSVKVVASFDEALEHIAKYSTAHTESIITEDSANAEQFLAEVDSAVVMVNASTRFTDGSEFGFGAEVGISTQKLHARGPMGLTELTSTKWLVRGSGQSRA